MSRVLPRPNILNGFLRPLSLGLAIAVAAAAPARAEPAMAAPSKLAAAPSGAHELQTGIFGTVAVRVSAVRMSGRWQEILDERADRLFQNPCPTNEAICATPVMRRWQEILSQRDELSRDPYLALQVVNALVNSNLRYVRDIDGRGMEDEWASPLDTVRRGNGDCEDYALLKMAMLAGLGLDPSGMHLVIGVIDAGKQGHSVLTVTIRGQVLILDNLSDGVRRDREMADYRPLYSLGPDGAWLHGYRRARSLTLAGW